MGFPMCFFGRNVLAKFAGLLNRKNQKKMKKDAKNVKLLRAVSNLLMAIIQK
jgi:hypothetical protein